MSDAPIGIFDSGLGGLSVAREIRSALPSEELLYFADSAYCPYGGRPLPEIQSRALTVAAALVERGAKAVVVACNTASGAALELLRERFSVPIIGLEPAVKPAVSLSRMRRIGVMATPATLRTERFGRLLRNYAGDVEVVAQACPGLPELVEAGETGGDRVQRVLEELLGPMREARVDTVVLGCTHYPFLRGAIAQVLGPDVRIIDSGPAIARQVRRVLEELDALSPPSGGGIRMLTTGDPAAVGVVAGRLWGEPVPLERVT